MDIVNIRREALARILATVQDLGGGQDLDVILELIARAVVEVIGFDAIAINVRTHHGDLAVRTVVGPPEMEQLRGGTLSHDGWLELLDSGAALGELRFLREPDLDDSVPHMDPWVERIEPPCFSGAADPKAEPWQPEFALLAPMWRSPTELLGVISVDLPRSGLTPDAEQRTLLELFSAQAGAAIQRVHAFDVAADMTNLYRAAFSASPAPTAVLDEHLCITDVNSAFHDLTDAVDGELLGRPLVELADLRGGEHLIAQLAGPKAGRSTVLAEECRLRHPRGQQWDRWVHVAIQRVDALSGQDRYVCIVSDRTASRAAMSEMRHTAEHDELTGLQVRSVGLRELERHTHSMTPGQQTVVALLYCDLDNFKAVNDTNGHLAGDELLVAVAARLRSIADTDDTVCRWGGDEFGLVVERRSITEIVDLARRLVAGVGDVAEAAISEDPVRRIGLSVGVAPFARQVAARVVMRAADTALYRSKTHPTDKVHVQPL
jgi:diguanylate cyclase (GGDEF)-like protein/PAS domain S-box-containing protein